MANLFKKAQKTAVTSNIVVYTAPAGQDSIILELDVSNTTASAITATVKIFDADTSTHAHVVKNAPIPSGGTLQIISGQKIIVEAGDNVNVEASGACDVICSILENVNS